PRSASTTKLNGIARSTAVPTPDLLPLAVRRNTRVLAFPFPMVGGVDACSARVPAAIRHLQDGHFVRRARSRSAQSPLGPKTRLSVIRGAERALASFQPLR